MIDLNERLTLINSYLGQLIDLKAGFLKELVLTPGKHADVLSEILTEEIERIKMMEKEANDYEEAERLREQEEDEKFDSHPRPEEVQ